MVCVAGGREGGGRRTCSVLFDDLTIQLTRVLTFGNRVLPVCLAIVCVCARTVVVVVVVVVTLFPHNPLPAVSMPHVTSERLVGVPVPPPPPRAALCQLSLVWPSSGGGG